MSGRLAVVVGVALATGGLGGCAGRNPAPPPFSETLTPELAFLVRNEVFTIRLDGTDRRSRGRVGDDRRRTGFPRFLPDGRIAVLADDTGGIFPYVSGAGGLWTRIAEQVTLHDSLCGARLHGASYLVFTNSPFTPRFPMSARLYRVDPDDPRLEAVAFEPQGAIAYPAPYDDGRVLVVRTLRFETTSPGTAAIELVRIDRAFDPNLGGDRIEVLSTLPPGFMARSPARLPDGRVVFIKSDPEHVSDEALGELMVIGRDNVARATGVTGVIALKVVGDRVIYEAGGGDYVTDLVMTDLEGPPVNITNTPYVSEHIGWSG